MSAMVIFGGRVSGERANAQHTLRVNVTYDFSSIRLFCAVVILKAKKQPYSFRDLAEIHYHYTRKP